MTRSGVLARLVVVTASVWAAGCSSGGPGATGTGAAGTGSVTGGASAGTAGTSGAAGAAGPGAAGVGAAGTGAPGVAGAGAAGTGSGAAGTSGAAGVGAAGVGAAGTGAAGAGTAGTAGTGAAGAKADGGSPTDGGGTVTSDAGSHGNKVLLYTKSTGFVHDSTITAAAEIAKAAAAVGLVTETSADATKFTSAGLAGYAGIVLIATAGEPIGSPGTMQIQALVDWVNAGGGLVAIENANHAYETSVPYMNLLGGDFAGHSGLGPDFCYKDGDHPSNMKLPATFPVTDEIYYFTKYRMDNVVVLRCGSDRRPISWIRQEGAGRFFYTALGHTKEIWTTPPLVDGHVLPGLLWSMGRAVP